MANDDIKKAIQGINNIFLKIGITFTVITLIVAIASIIISVRQSYTFERVSKQQTDLIKYYIEKSYDYEYEIPDFENVNINGDSNNYGKDD